MTSLRLCPLLKGLDFWFRTRPSFRECGGLRVENSLKYSRIWLLLGGLKTKQRKQHKLLVYRILTYKQQTLKTTVGLEG